MGDKLELFPIIKNIPNNNNRIIVGNSHHFFLTFKKSQSSNNNGLLYPVSMIISSISVLNYFLFF